MTFKQACKMAQEDSKNGYTQHVNAQIIVRTNHKGLTIGHRIQASGYMVSDWRDNTTGSQLFKR